MSDGSSTVFDLTGRQLWAGEVSVVGWVDSGNLLLFGEGGVSGLSLASGRTTALGGRPGNCGWDATHLTCPVPFGVFVWPYR